MPLENDDFQPTREDGYERRDASVRGLLLLGLGLAIALAFIGFAMKWTFDWLSAESPRGNPAASFVQGRPLPPGPRLQAMPHEDLGSYCSGQVQELNTYGWIDKQNGIVHIPIDRAMDIVMQQGFPARAEGEIPSYDKQALAPVGDVNALPATGIAGQCAFVEENSQTGAGHNKSENAAPRGAE
ncbi:MAG: hypothetical protein ACRD8A_19170 [Candidatus Acidiferrales bacterium]